VHKSQGSEFDHAALVLPGEESAAEAGDGKGGTFGEDAEQVEHEARARQGEIQ
jgi:hypothetical protein